MAAGYTVEGDGVVEIDPEVSFRGEGLAVAIEGVITAPCRVTRDESGKIVVIAA